jgi:hypothetical protein
MYSDEGAHDFCGRVLAVQSIPMFHGLGIVSVVMAVSIHSIQSLVAAALTCVF